MKRLLSRPMAWGGVLAVAWVLAACGGEGVGSGGTGAPVSVSSGTVSGFGSVWVDGLEYDDAAARVRLDSVEGAPDNSPGPVRLGLGQRVELDFVVDDEGRRVVSQVRVSPQLIGPVTSLAPLTVAGQRVLVNDDPAEGPLTLLDGVADPSALRIGQRIEVHGLPRRAGHATVVLASRIATLTAAGRDPWLRLGGTVSDLGAEGFRLGSLRVGRDDRTVVVPGHLALTEGQSVRVWTRQGLQGPQDDPHVVADRIQIVHRQWLPQQTVRLSGPVHTCEDGQWPRSGFVCLDEAVIELASAQVRGAGLGDLVDGRYVDVQARHDAARQVLRDARFELRTADDAASQARLAGEVADASGSRFTVRDTVVEMEGSTQRLCQPADGVRVLVTGRVNGDHVLAGRVQCLAP